MLIYGVKISTSKNIMNRRLKDSSKFFRKRMQAILPKSIFLIKQKMTVPSAIFFPILMMAAGTMEQPLA